MQIRATQHFHHGLLLGTTQIRRKETQRNTLNIFEVLVFLKESRLKKREKQKWEKLFTRESSQQEKGEQGNPFGFSF